MDFHELQDLWRDRDRLTEAQWTRLYRLVHGVLAKARMYDGLDRDDLVQGFFLDKVVRGRSTAVPERPAALLQWFARYQASMHRALRSEPSFEAAELPAEDTLPAAECEAAEPLFRASRANAVQAFFDTLDEQEKILVQHAHCDQQSVLSVAQAHRIASAHHHSKRLGLVLTRHALPSDWSQTKLGRFVTRALGISTDARDDLLQVLRLLCETAQQWWSRACATTA